MPGPHHRAIAGPHRRPGAQEGEAESVMFAISENWQVRGGEPLHHFYLMHDCCYPTWLLQACICMLGLMSESMYLGLDIFGKVVL